MYNERPKVSIKSPQLRIFKPLAAIPIRSKLNKIMKDKIFLIDKDQKLVELNETEFITEDQFQELLENYPNLLSGNQINPENPRKWILISREFGVPSEMNGNNVWSLDHLFIDQDGIPTLIEVKRRSDTRIRREVVGQMLDYAANAVTYWSIDEIKSKFEKVCEINEIEPAVSLISTFDEIDDYEKFWEIVDTNLKAGKIRMLFVADKIPKELQRIIEFLNEQMSPAEILGVEIKQFGSAKLKTLVPRVIGKTSVAQAKKGNRKTFKWDEKSFFTELEKNSGIKSVETVKKIINHFEPKVSELWFGEGRTIGSIIPILEINKKNHFLFSIWTDGKIEIPFQWMKNKNAFRDINKRKIILNKLNQIKGINIQETKLNKRPWIDLKTLYDNESMKKFLDIFDWMIDEYNKQCC